jgi:hypothetical protein
MQRVMFAPSKAWTLGVHKHPGPGLGRGFPYVKFACPSLLVPARGTGKGEFIRREIALAMAGRPQSHDVSGKSTGHTAYAYKCPKPKGVLHNRQGARVPIAWQVRRGSPGTPWVTPNSN